jgi:hypothetical protein
MPGNNAGSGGGGSSFTLPPIPSHWQFAAPNPAVQPPQPPQNDPVGQVFNWTADWMTMTDEQINNLPSHIRSTVLQLRQNAHYEAQSNSTTALAMMKERHEKYPLLQVTPIRPKRSVNMPTFKLQFDNITDITRRLMKSLIYVGGELYYVSNIHKEGDDFVLYVTDENEKTYRIPYSTPEINLRSAEPRYLQYNGGTAYYFRPPLREQAQGMSRTNIRLKYFGTDAHDGCDRVTRMIKGMRKVEPVQWSSTYADLMLKEEIINSMRMSNNIAIGMSQDKLIAEYKGRYFGTLKDDCVFVDAQDFQKPWVQRDVARIGCKLREKEA